MNIIRLWLLGTVLSGSLAAMPSCGTTARTDGTDSNTHWLRECEGDESCGSLKCVCGVCSEECSEPSDCSQFGKSATCAVPEGCASEGAPSACVREQSEGSGGSTSKAGAPSYSTAGAPDLGSGGNGGSSNPSTGGEGNEAVGGAASCPPGQVALEVYPLLVFNSRPDQCIDRTTPLHGGCATPGDAALDTPAGFPAHTCVRHVSSPELPSCCQLYVTTTPVPSAEGWQECDESEQAMVEGSRDCNEPACEAGSHRAARYEAERDCLRSSVHVGCAELLDPETTVPTDWPTTQCVRRLSDDELFLAGQPVRATEWADCTAQELQTVTGAALCD